MIQVHCMRCGRLCAPTPSADGETLDFYCPNKHGVQKIVPIEKPPAPPATLEELADKAADALAAALGSEAQIFIFAHRSGETASQIRAWDPADLAAVLGEWFFKGEAEREEELHPGPLGGEVGAIENGATNMKRLGDGEKSGNAGSPDSVGASEQSEGTSGGQGDPAGN